MTELVAILATALPLFGLAVDQTLEQGSDMRSVSGSKRLGIDTILAIVFGVFGNLSP